MDSSRENKNQQRNKFNRVIGGVSTYEKTLVMVVVFVKTCITSRRSENINYTPTEVIVIMINLLIINLLRKCAIAKAEILLASK